MAQFTFTHSISYDGNGDGANFPFDTNAISGTLTDGEADGVFDAGDTVTTATPISDPTPIQGVYLGTTLVDGQTFPAFYFSDTNESVVFLTFNPVTIPSILQVDETANFDAPCFLTGTMIATPVGQTPVELLQIGDAILTADGAQVAVKWIGRRSVSTAFRPADRLRPVCIDAGALSNGLPLRDLHLTPDHALMIDGLLVNAGALVNDVTVRLVPLDDLGAGYTVYHVETEAHEVILAEGVPAETYIDYVGRQAFENHGAYLALYGEDRAIAEMVAPRVTSARHVPPALRARLDRGLAA